MADTETVGNGMLNAFSNAPPESGGVTFAFALANLLIELVKLKVHLSVDFRMNLLFGVNVLLFRIFALSGRSSLHDVSVHRVAEAPRFGIAQHINRV